jgi:hypothetical protein
MFPSYTSRALVQYHGYLHKTVFPIYCNRIRIVDDTTKMCLFNSKVILINDLYWNAPYDNTVTTGYKEFSKRTMLLTPIEVFDRHNTITFVTNKSTNIIKFMTLVIQYNGFKIEYHTEYITDYDRKKTNLFHINFN